jgi:hypothetical protein
MLPGVVALASRLCGMIHQPGRRRRRLACAGLLLVALGSLGAPAGARVSGARARSSRRSAPRRRVSTGDRASTHAYLQAEYEFDLAVIGAAPQSRAAVESLATRLGGECPGVLAGAPGEEPSPGSPRLGGPAPSAKARGEADRISRQRSALEGELTTGLLAAAFQPYRPALATLAAALTPLRWSDPRVALKVRSELARSESAFEPVSPNVCADMRSWVASGYRRLSAATKAFLAKQTTGLASQLEGGSVEGLLKRYEGPAEHALIRRANRLQGREFKGLLSWLQVGTKLRATIGIRPQAEGIPERGSRVGGGRTRDGGHFTVRVRAPVRILHGPRCGHEVAVEYSSVSDGAGGTFFGGSGSSCLPGAPLQRPSVGCEEGRLRIEARVRPDARSVALELSDGSSVRSRVVAIPRRLGGPARFYVQSLRGPTPYPVSLTELDARGRSLAVLRLSPVRDCHRTTFVPPTFRTIVRGKGPSGTAFTISASSFRFGRHREFNLSSDARDSGGLFSGIASSEGEGRPARPAILAQVGLEASCSSPPFTIVYGWLRAPGAHVLAQTPTGLVSLNEAKIPASLHTKGVVAYGVFPTPPTALIVRAAGGRTLAREDLSRRAAEQTQYCEGYAEP